MILMAAVSGTPYTPAFLPATFPRFFSTLWEIPAIQRVGYSVSGSLVHLWVLFRRGDEEALRLAVEAEREFRQDPAGRLVDIHYFALDEISADLLPPSETLFER